MPLFSNKFTPKKTPTRKAPVSNIHRECDPEITRNELGLEVGKIKIKLGHHEASFEDGNWIPESGTVSGTYKENVKLKKTVEQLEEENNLLRLKVELLLDMLTETTAEFQLQEKEIEELRKVITTRKR